MTLAEHYTRREVERILGVKPRTLRYWERLRLVSPQARWGERFYSFGDLVALETVKRLAARRVPARRLRRAIAVLEEQLGHTSLPLSNLRVLANGRRVVVVPPGPDARPVEPLTGQFLLDFETQHLARKLQKIASRTAEQWFELALGYDTRSETLQEAVAAYRQATALAPEWVEAHINLGVALFQQGQLGEARRAFEAALVLEPANPLAHFNLACVLDETGQIDEGIGHLRRAIEISPGYADAHFNLALACEKRGLRREAQGMWAAYLKLAPNGPWSDYARSRLATNPGGDRTPGTIPFRRK